MIKPDYYYKSLLSIPINDLKKLNKRIIIIDLDNTLLPFNQAFPNQDAVNYINELSNNNFDVHIVSNNYYSRIFFATTNMNCSFLHYAMKPLTFRFRKYLKDKEIEYKDCVFIGDQLMTDIVVARKLHLASILVDPLTDSDLPITRFNRNIDLRIRKKLKEKNLLKSI